MGLRGPRALRRLTLARIVERRALVRQLRGATFLGRGPVIVVIDTSGSMSGAPVIFAKAIALAIVTRAVERKRPVAVMTFGAAGQIVEHEFSIRENAAARIARVLELGFGGGTDFDTPLRRVIALSRAKPWSRADAVFVTDGDCAVSPVVLAELRAAKAKLDLEVLGVLVCHGRGLHDVADSLWSVDPAAPDSAAIERLRHRL